MRYHLSFIYSYAIIAILCVYLAYALYSVLYITYSLVDVARYAWYNVRRTVYTTYAKLRII